MTIPVSLWYTLADEGGAIIAAWDERLTCGRSDPTKMLRSVHFAQLRVFAAGRGSRPGAEPVRSGRRSKGSLQPPLAVYISVDMEGVAGVVTADQLTPQGFEYERFRHFMTDEALAAVRAAKAAGATKILVADSHGNAESLLIDEFPADVHIIRSWPRHGAMMARPRFDLQRRDHDWLPRVGEQPCRSTCSHYFQRYLHPHSYQRAGRERR